MPPLNRRLTTLDASFLYFEKPKEPLHIGSCGIYEGDLRKDEVIEMLAQRLHRLPRYRQKVVFAPFSVAHPTWEDDDEFAIESHVEEVELPPPGDDRVLSEVGGEHFAGMLDRRRPLWKLILLRGVAGGATALISKVHHAMVDGVSGVDLTLVMHDLKREADPVAPAVEPWQAKPMPDPVSLLQDAVRDRLAEVTRSWTDEAFRGLRPAEAAASARKVLSAFGASLPSMMRPVPPVPFNGRLSGERRFVWVPLPFTDVRAIKSSLGGTVNDLVLAILGGGFGRYLRAHGVATDGVELRAMCPVSMRDASGRGQLGNLVSTMIAPLFVGIRDPLERLAAVRDAMGRLKSADQAGGFHALTELGNRIPPSWQAFAGLFSAPNAVFHTVSTNVPGPQIPLFLSGHQLLRLYPLGPLAAGLGVFVAILSYNQTLTIGLTVDPRLVPDAWDLARNIEESYGELAAAAAPAETIAAAKIADADPPKPAPRRKKVSRRPARKPTSSSRNKSADPASA